MFAKAAAFFFSKSLVRRQALALHHVVQCCCDELPLAGIIVTTLKGHDAGTYDSRASAVKPVA